MFKVERHSTLMLAAAGVVVACGLYVFHVAGEKARAVEQTRPQLQPAHVGGDALRNVDELVQNLANARKALSGVGDRRTRERLELLISRAELQANDLRKDLIGLLSSAASGQSISDADFGKLLQQLKKESFDNNKLTLLKQVMTGNRFKTSQVRDILKTFTFDQGRSEAALAIHPNVVDPGNFYQALDVFTFDSHKKDIMEKLTPK